MPWGCIPQHRNLGEELTMIVHLQRAMFVGVLAFCGFAVAPINAQVLLSDNFDDGDAAGWTEYDGAFAVMNGEYTITTSAGCQDGRAVNGDPAWTDYQIDVDFFVDSSDAGAHAAVLFHVQDIASGCDAGKYYQAFVYQDQVGFCLINDSAGFCTVLTTASVSTPLQQWHHMAVRVEGASVTMAIDDANVLSFGSLVEYPAGRIALKSINVESVRYDNVLVRGPGSWSWTDLGHALAGSAGTPSLQGEGELLPTAPVNLELSQAKPFSAAILVVGASDLSGAFKGGVLVPTPSLLIPAVTDGFGSLLFGGPWPSGMPSGLSLWMQFWISDSGGVKGFSASNALRADVP